MAVSSIMLIAGIVIVVVAIGFVWQVSKGSGNSKRDSKGGGGRVLAPAYLIKKAENGDLNAQKELGYIYATGAQKVRRNIPEALEWYERAAKRGDTEAQNAIGTLYARGGDGIMQNYKKAAAWYEKAAERGLTQAQMNLAGMYELGQGVLKSYMTAYMWYTLALDGADSDTREQLKEKTKIIMRSMTQEQVLEAKKRADNWRRGVRGH